MAWVYENISPQEFAGWQIHLRRFPPGDYLAQSILAGIWEALCRANGAKDARAAQIAPWLNPPEMRQAKAIKEQRRFVYEQLESINQND